MIPEITRACPFCGAADDDLVVLADPGDVLGMSAVTCNICTATGPSDILASRAVELWNGAALQALGRAGEERL